MCTGAEVGYLIALAGTAAKTANTVISAKRQDRQAAAGIRQGAEDQRRAADEVNRQISDVAASSPAAERAASLQGYIDTLRRASDVTGAPVDPLGVGGSRFAERVAGGEAETRERGTTEAGRLSVIDAASRQRQREGEGVSATASRIGEFGRQSQAADFINRLRIASKRPNELVNLLGTVAENVGGFYSAGGSSAFKNISADPNLANLFRKGTIVDAPTGTPGFNPYFS